MKLRPKALDCPNCGASIEVRNAPKAKSVVCGTCTSQIDLTKPGFEVLGQLGPGREPPQGPLHLGLQGTIDGKAHEIIGRVRFREDEESFWDEWLLLSEDGAYRWLSEEPGAGWALHEPFVPDQPITPADLRQGAHVTVGGKRLLVRERSRARIVHVEGELTWRARVGDRIEYADASLGSHAYAFEWSEDEFEAYTARSVPRGVLWRWFSLQQAQPEAAPHSERAARLRRAAGALFVGALVAFGLVLVAPLVRSEVARSDGRTAVPREQLAGSLSLAELELAPGLGSYELQAQVRMPPGVDRYELTLAGPAGTEGALLRFEHVGKGNDVSTASARFRVETAGTWRLALRGAGSSPSGELGQIDWTLYRALLVSRWFVVAGVALIALSLWLFVKAGKETLIASSLYKRSGYV